MRQAAPSATCARVCVRVACVFSGIIISFIFRFTTVGRHFRVAPRVHVRESVCRFISFIRLSNIYRTIRRGQRVQRLRRIKKKEGERGRERERGEERKRAPATHHQSSSFVRDWLANANEIIGDFEFFKRRTKRTKSPIRACEREMGGERMRVLLFYAFVVLRDACESSFADRPRTVSA